MYCSQLFKLLQDLFTKLACQVSLVLKEEMKVNNLLSLDLSGRISLNVLRTLYLWCLQRSSNISSLIFGCHKSSKERSLHSYYGSMPLRIHALRKKGESMLRLSFSKCLTFLTLEIRSFYLLCTNSPLTLLAEPFDIEWFYDINVSYLVNFKFKLISAGLHIFYYLLGYISI